jgi:hypothetical protein
MAQDTASIVGTIVDASGAAMPNVKITVADVNKGVERPTTTDSVGAFKVGFLPIGTYTVTAEAPGFEKYVQTDIILQIGQIQRVDVQMKVGTTTQEVTVTGNVIKVQTDDAVQSSVVTGTQIAALNLNGRQFVGLATLVPGAAVNNGYNPTAVGKKLLGYIEFSGNRHDYNDWRQDGGNIYNWQANGNFHTTPSLDSIGEFKISTSNYGADQGARSGILVEMSTKSGTKNLHGDAYDYVRNDIMDANPFFTNRQLAPSLPFNAPKVPLKWNDFGFTVGGPFEIPGHYNTDRTKTFFFYSQEFRRVRQGETLSASAPTARMRAGDFSECDPASPNFNSLISSCVMPKDPATGMYYPVEGQTVPVSSQAKDLLNAWVPLPNNGPVGWQKTLSVPINWQQQMIRVDQNIGNNTRAYARYTHEGFTDTLVPVFYTSSSYDALYSVYGGPSYNWVFHLTHTFTPAIVNDVMVHYDMYHNNWANYAGPDAGPNAVGKPSDWSMKTIFPANEAQPVMPGFSVSDPTLNFAEDWGPRPYIANEHNLEIKDDLAITKGTHFLKLGFDYIYGGDNDWDIYTQISTNATAQGELAFSNGSTVSTGSALADMDLGRIASYAEVSATQGGVPVGGYPHEKFAWWALEPYLQDDWRVTKRLTLNLGVRFFYLTRTHDKLKPPSDVQFRPNLFNGALQAPLLADGNIAAPNPATGQIYNGTTFGNGLVECGVSGVPQGCQDPTGVRPAPRFGFAWQPFSSPNTVVRGGYGMFYDQLTSNEPNAEGDAGNVPINRVGTGYNIIGYGEIAPGASGPIPFAMNNANQPYPMTNQFSLGVQHEFSGNNRLSVSYVGNISEHLSRTRQFNEIPDGSTTMMVPALAGTQYCDVGGVNGLCDVQANLINLAQSSEYFMPYQGYSSLSLGELSAQSNYHSLQSEFRHEFGRGLTFQASYTWSHMIDDGSNYGSDPYIDDSNMRRYYATSNLNRAQVATINYVYKLPFLKNASNHYVKNAFGGWEVSGITSFFTGTPVSFGCGIAGYGTGIGENSQCNSLGPVKIQKSINNDPIFGPTVQWTNPANVGQLQMSQLYANNEPGMFGWMGLNPLTGPGRNNWDIALHKDFITPWFGGEHSTLQFRWETFNTFNHTQWKSVGIGCSGATPPGQPCSGNQYNLGNGEVSGAWDPRIMQLALKFIF